MKNSVLKPYAALLLASGVLFGCASTDTTEDTALTATETSSSATAEADATTQQDFATDMEAQKTQNEEVSANNQLGQGQNIVAIAQNRPELSTFLQLVRAANLVTVLESPADYTVFAPTNQAFAALPAGTVEMLMEPSNKMELTDILQAHVIPERIMSYQLKNHKQIKTAEGSQVPVQVNERGMVVGGAEITTPDIKASNGVIHIVNRVLLPPKN